MNDRISRYSIYNGHKLHSRHNATGTALTTWLYGTMDGWERRYADGSKWRLTVGCLYGSIGKDGTWMGGTGTFNGFDTERLLLYNRRSSSILGSRQMGRLPPFYSPTLVECGNLEDSVWGWARFRLATICTDISACSLLLPVALPEVSNWLL